MVCYVDRERISLGGRLVNLSHNRLAILGQGCQLLGDQLDVLEGLQFNKQRERMVRTKERFARRTKEWFT